MASAWGTSWGVSWGSSWGATADVVIVVPAVPKKEEVSVSGSDFSSKVSVDRKPILQRLQLKEDDSLRKQLLLEDEELISIVGLLIQSGTI